MFDRMVNQLSAAATSGSGANTTGTSASAQAAAALMKFSGFSSSSNAVPKEPEKPVEEIVREEDGLLSLDAAEQMLKWHAEAVGRCVVLSPSGDV